MRIGFKKAFALGAAVLIGANTITLSAATANQTIKISYNNIKVTHNGQYKTPVNEPFLYNGSVYVGLRDAGTILGAGVNWDPNTKTVQITADEGVSSSELAAKNLEIAKLKSEVSSLEAKLKQYEDQAKEEEAEKGKLSSITSTDLKDMLKDLQNEYDDEFKVDWTFDLKVDTKAEALAFTVSYESKYDESYFVKIDQGKLDGFLEEMCDDIQSELGAFKINGTLVDDTKDEDLGTFTMDEKGKYAFKQINSKTKLRRVEEYLETTYKKLPKISHDTLNNHTINVDGFHLDQKNDYDYMVFEVDTDLKKEHLAAWNSLEEGSRTRDLKYWLDDIASDIAKQFGCDEDDVEGYIFNDYGKLIAKFEDGELTLRSFSE